MATRQVFYAQYYYYDYFLYNEHTKNYNEPEGPDESGEMANSQLIINDDAIFSAVRRSGLFFSKTKTNENKHIVCSSRCWIATLRWR